MKTMAKTNQIHPTNQGNRKKAPETDVQKAN